MSIVAASTLNPRARRFETERIHASTTVLLLATIGLGLYGVGRLLGSNSVGTPHQSQVGSALAFVGVVLVVIALVLHVDHLSFRIGRSAVVLMCLGAILLSVGNLLSVFNMSPLWFNGPGWVLGGFGLAMVAVHKEGQMKPALAEYAAGSPWQLRVTVHASFLSLITGAIGLIAFGIGRMGLASVPGRGPLVLAGVGWVLLTIGVISHVEHLVPRIGLGAVIAAILAPIFWAANFLFNAIDPTSAANNVFWRVCLGIGTLLGALACALALQKKRSTDR